MSCHAHQITRGSGRQETGSPPNDAFRPRRPRFGGRCCGGPRRPRPVRPGGACSRRQAQRGEGSQSVAAPRGSRSFASPGAAAEGPGPPERARVPSARGPRQREPGPGARGHREEGIGVPQGLPEARRGESGGQSQKAAERRRAHEVPRDARRIVSGDGGRRRS